MSRVWSTESNPWSVPRGTLGLPRGVLVAVVVAVALSSLGAEALACRCRAVASGPRAMKRADAVFTGTVEALTIDERYKSAHARWLDIRVDRVFKGDVPRGETIRVDLGVTSCKISWMEVGELWVVFATRADDGSLTTRQCVGTRRMAAAGAKLAPNELRVLERLEKAAAKAAPRAAARAGSYTFDGYAIGTPFDRVMARAPYDNPCDNDPIDKRARRFMVYGALPCRDRTFPEHTTVALYIGYRDEDRYSAPIEAIAYMGGHYFDQRSDFPVAVGSLLAGGEGIDIYSDKLGPATARFTLERKGTKLSVTRFGEEAFLLDDGAKVVGVVVGKMPRDPESEQWRGLMQMWQRYTKDVR